MSNPIDGKHRKRERSRTVRMSDCGDHCVRLDFHCDRPVLSIVGEIVPGLYLDRCRGKIRWSINNCEDGDWDRFVRSAFDDESERRELVSIDWGKRPIA